MGHRIREGALLVLLFTATYFLLALLTYSPADPGWSYTGPTDEVHNAAGPAGAWVADVLLYLFGLLAYLFPVMVAWSGWLVFRSRGPADDLHPHLMALRWLGFVLTVAAGSALASIYAADLITALPMGAGGVLGELLRSHLIAVFSGAGSTLLLLAVFLSGFTLFTGVSWLAVMDAVGGFTLWALDETAALPRRLAERWAARRARRQRTAAVNVQKKKAENRRPTKIEPLIKQVKPSPRAEKERQVPLFEPSAEGGLPGLALLTEPGARESGYSKEALHALSRQVEMKLKDFGIEAEVESVHPGPVVTLFELHLAPGTKASRVTNLAKDLARALSTVSVRVVEVIPGKSTIGIEIPNERRETVFLSEVLRSEAYDKARSPLTLSLGKDIAGHPVVADLGRMPHALIAGTTGSGKSVAINAMVLSLLYKASPEQVRLIMIDPKMLELSVYEGIPHLLTPVVTDMKEAANALRWCVAEMERRYRLMAALGVRNIAGFNRKVVDAEKAGRPIVDPLFEPDPLANGPQSAPPLEQLPYIVVIIDELADMMMVVGKKVEELIARLAQKARAAGVHLLLATQRPSVDVITGLIKANIPTRIAFQVSARVDSRTILDQMGAEHLLGHGDMLYLAPGGSIPQRIHGAYVDDNEVHRVVEYLRGTGEPNYVDEVLQEPAEAIPGLSEGQGGTEESDPLYDEAVRIVTETRRASISGVQRRLKIGYNRAARLIEEMERTGVVSAPEHNGNREVLAPPPPGD
ncbi:MAG: DNA translocase FtsK 4TM domain-containing protein [Chromatiales bacterium]|jgi:S-DNA-T family DNA segregation ATPase FtsK/SpoIIIE